MIGYDKKRFERQNLFYLPIKLAGLCYHGNSEIEVYRELCIIVDEWLKISMMPYSDR